MKNALTAVVGLALISCNPCFADDSPRLRDPIGQLAAGANQPGTGAGSIPTFTPLKKGDLPSKPEPTYDGKAVTGYAKDEKGVVLIIGNPDLKTVQAFQAQYKKSTKEPRNWAKIKRTAWRQFRTKVVPVTTLVFSGVGAFIK